MIEKIINYLRMLGVVFFSLIEIFNYFARSPLMMTNVHVLWPTVDDELFNATTDNVIMRKDQS